MFSKLNSSKPPPEVVSFGEDVAEYVKEVVPTEVEFVIAIDRDALCKALAAALVSNTSV